MFQALRIPDFRLLWGGGLVSSLGSWLLVLAVPAHILAVTGSLRDTGLTLAAEYLPQLVLGPVAGALADGWDRRRLMIGANLFCAVAVAAMLLGTSPGRYWVVYAALIAENAGTVLCAPALRARTPAIVGTGPLLSSANSLTSASSGIVRLIGGPLGGVLLAVCGIRWLICADTFSYLLAAAAMFMTSRSGCGHPDRAAALSAVGRDLVEGARVLGAQPVVRALLPVTIIFLTANASLSAVLIPFGIQRLGGSEHTGLLLSCLGAGFLLGAPIIRAFLDRAEPRNLLTVTLTATAGAYFLLFTSSSLATALPAAAAVGMAGSMSLVIPQTTLQRVIPGAVLGRVCAVFITGEAAATLIGSIAGPFLAQAAHLIAVAIAASLATACAAGLAFRAMPAMEPRASRMAEPALALERAVERRKIPGRRCRIRRARFVVVANASPSAAGVTMIKALSKLDVITLFVEDLPGSKKFYSEIFGLEVIWEDDASAVVKMSNLIINLLRVSNAPTLIEPIPVAAPGGSRALLTIEVDDANAVCAELEAHGVKLLNGPIDRPWGRRTAAFADPAGNTWEIAQVLS